MNEKAIDAALKAWFASPPSETDQGLERSMAAALTAAIPHLAPPLRAREEIARAIDAQQVNVGSLDWADDQKEFYEAGARFMQQEIRDALLSSTAGQEWREPEGWQLVPKELTEDMAAEIECSDGTDEGWQRALAACPPLPVRVAFASDNGTKP